MDDIYGAILARNGTFVTADTDEIQANHPRHVYDDSGEQTYVGHFHGWIGDGDTNGSWVGFYRTQMWLIHDHKLIRQVDIHDDYIVTKDRPFVVMDSLPGMDFIYLSAGDPSRYRYYLRTAIGKMREQEYQCWFGLGLTNNENQWAINKQNKTFGFSNYEIRQYDALFESQTRQKEAKI